MAKKRRRRIPSILLAGLDDCLLGMMYPHPAEDGVPVAVYSADMIAARLRDEEKMTLPEARAFVTDRIEQNWLGPGTARVIWAATSEDFGELVADA
jgi:hypothetical protein